MRAALRMLARSGPLAAVLLLMLTLGAAAGAAGGMSARVGRAPRHPAGSQVIGALPGTVRLALSVVLAPRDPAGLARYAAQVSTPGSSVYRRYLTVAQFRQRFAPAGSQVDAVRAELRARGLSAGTVSRNGLAIPVTATAGAIANAMSISFERVRLAGGRVAYANTAAPQFPASVAGTVQTVLGLDSLVRAAPLGVRSPSAGVRHLHAGPRVVTGGPQPCSAAVSDAGAYGAYTADQLASAYGFSSLYGAGDLGNGQTVALFELEPYSAADISAYQSCYGTSAPVSNVLVDGGAGAGSGSGEAALDIEDVIGLAPRAGIRVYEGPNSSAGLYDTYAQIVSDNAAKVISTSWGLCESSQSSTLASSENTLFEEAATQGQSVFAAAGDSGSTDCGGSSLAVDDPASQPYVTGVGGTSLSALGPPPTESVWNDGKSGGAGGGGVSSLWPMPSYQTGASSPLNVINANSSGVPCGAGSSGYCREVPDVSADADENTGYVIYYKSSWTAFGGTSAAAPLWAAFTAVANASSACAGTPAGFANPVLYGAAAGAYASDFNDITSGTNSFTTGGLYPAGPAYDMASGLGTPTAGLAGALCGELVPAVTLTSPANGSATGSATPELAGAAGTATGDSPTVTVRIYSGPTASGLPVQTLTATESAGAWSVVPTVALADGTYTAQAQQTNTSSNRTGYSSSATFVVDTTLPVNTLRLAGRTGGGSYYPGSGSIVYYEGRLAGSFELQDAVSDLGSGPASSTFAPLSGSTGGWSFTSSSVLSPVGGPYVSSPFSWATGTSSAPIETVTGGDRAGNAAQTTLTFENDSSPPVGSVSYTNGPTSTVALSVSFSARDSASGVDFGLGQLQRASAALSNGTCGRFGSFRDIGPAGVTSPYRDSGVTPGNCYQYRYLAADNVGNRATIGPSGVVAIAGRPRHHLPKLTLRIRKQALRSVLRRGLRLAVSSSQAVSAKLQLVLSARNARHLGLGSGRHAVVIASLRRQIRAGRTVSIRLRLTGPARSHLRSVRRLLITVTFAATGSGGTATISRRLRLTR